MYRDGYIIPDKDGLHRVGQLMVRTECGAVVEIQNEQNEQIEIYSKVNDQQKSVINRSLSYVRSYLSRGMLYYADGSKVPFQKREPKPKGQKYRDGWHCIADEFRVKTICDLIVEIQTNDGYDLEVYYYKFGHKEDVVWNLTIQEFSIRLYHGQIVDHTGHPVGRRANAW